MKRIVVSDKRAGIGWFDADNAQAWEETTRWDGRNHVSRATGSQWHHERLWRTASGAWAVEFWSNYQGEVDGCRTATPDQAAEWFVRCELEPPPELAEAVRQLEL
jgi:hypothetical protein